MSTKKYYKFEGNANDVINDLNEFSEQYNAEDFKIHFITPTHIVNNLNPSIPQTGLYVIVETIEY